MKNKIEVEPITFTDSLRAGRAIGAMFFFFFGGAWISYWAYQTFNNRVVSVMLIIVTTLILTFFAFRKYQLFKVDQAVESLSPAKRKADRNFYIVNVTQWIVILVVGNVLANIGLSNWVIPAAIFIIGVHFLPLAFIFTNRYHLITCSGLILLSIIYPFIAPGGASDPVGCLGAGIILWISAIWAITVIPSVESKIFEKQIV
jgi:magnesium-transporting ATPase (P-type)